jgi:integrase
LPERREAERAFAEHMASREAVRLGLPDNSGWQMAYAELVEKFLNEAPISSDERRNKLSRVLRGNDLDLRTVSELAKPGPLTAKCRAIAVQRSDVYVRDTLQQALKQLTAWSASVGVLPFDPLSGWARLPRTSEKEKRRAFLPEEVRAILEAAAERDALCGRTHSMVPVFEAVLFTGNRPGAVLAAKVRDFDPSAGRIILPEGRGKKRNGMAYVSAPFAKTLTGYLAGRGRLAGDAPLFLSPDGSVPDRDNVSKEFVRCMILAFVRLSWPRDCPAAGEVEPVEVAALIERGRVRGFDGAPPRDPKKLDLRRRHVQAVEDVAALVAPQVERLMDRRDFYCLRMTHISWARQLVNRESVMAQVGHAPQDTEDRHYLDLVDATLSAQAVWDVLAGEKELRGAGRRREAMRLAAGFDLSPNTGQDGPSQAPEVDLKVDLIAATAAADTITGRPDRAQVLARRAHRHGATPGI